MKLIRFDKTEIDGKTATLNRLIKSIFEEKMNAINPKTVCIITDEISIAVISEIALFNSERRGFILPK